MTSWTSAITAELRSDESVREPSCDGRRYSNIWCVPSAAGETFNSGGSSSGFADQASGAWMVLSMSCNTTGPSISRMHSDRIPSGD